MSVKDNKNAVKDKRGQAEEHLNIRLPAEAKRAYRRKAKARGMNLTEWVIESLDNAK